MIDKNKQYKTRDGREVRIYATDGNESVPIHGAVLTDGMWNVFCWNADGRWRETERQHSFDLIEVVPLIECWAVLPETLSGGYAYAMFIDRIDAIEYFEQLPAQHRIVRLREVSE